MMATEPERNETTEMWRAVRSDQQQRNNERVRVAVARRGEIDTWADAQGVELHVDRYCEHWRFVLPGRSAIVNWWPGTGRAQVDRRDGRPAKAQPVSGWEQVRDRIIMPLVEATP